MLHIHTVGYFEMRKRVVGAGPGVGVHGACVLYAPGHASGAPEIVQASNEVL